MKGTFLTRYLNSPLEKRYLFYSIGYGLSTLLVPLTVQYLVNYLALAGIWLNIVTVLLIIAAGLILSQLLRFCQFVLMEYLQREIFTMESLRWQKLAHPNRGVYFFEIPSILKSFSKAFTDIVEMLLVGGFGFLALISFHPFFILLAVLISAGVYAALINFDKAVASSIEESNVKYSLYFSIKAGTGVETAKISEYLLKRDIHFAHIRRNFFIVSSTIVLSQILLLGVGVFFIQRSQLSIGQFVSAEIILTGIFVTVGKLPQSLEAIYDFETSHYKLNYALEESDG